MKNEDILIIKKMIKYCNDIISFQQACNMCIIQIGELANRLSDETKESSKDILWRAIKGMRNLHVHDYENVDLEIVWNTLLKDIPALRQSLERLL